MKYEQTEIKDLYDKFFEIQQNQFNIFQELRSACVAFIGLESFTGGAAFNAKAYIEEVHLPVIDSFNMALMELEVRLVTLRADFVGTVDDSDVAILDEAFISGKMGEFDTLSSKLDSIEVDAVEAVSKVTSYVTLAELPYADLKTALNGVHDDIDGVIKSMHAFDERHQDDLENVCELITLIDQAIVYMGGAIQSNWASYSQGAALGLDWAARMADRRMMAFTYSRNNDPTFWETCYVAAVTQCGFDVIEQMSGPIPEEVYEWMRNGCVDDIALLSPEAIEAIRAYRAGIILTPVNKYGDIYIQMRTRSGRPLSDIEHAAALKRLNAPLPDGRDSHRLFNTKRGLCVWKNGQQASDLFGKVDNWDEMIDLTDDIRKGNFSRAGAMTKMGKILKGAGIAGDVLTLGMDVAEGFYDERTQSFTSEVDGYEMAGALAVDGAVIAGSIASTVLVASVLGSAVPVLGTAVGAIAGLIVGIGVTVLDVVQFGEPPKSVLDHAKDGLSDALESAGNFFSKVFW
ncbi:MAG: LXG domain-containing protein [Coriobacteriales bacterium]|jgi:hypothetical protein|nr:LXG domain-containing protein [Coriobacteriales bacterium]